MTTIQYNKQTVNVPTNWDDITLGVYERFSQLKPATARERAEVVAIACGVDVSLLMDWPVDAFRAILEAIDFIFRDNPAEPCAFIEVDGIRYIVPIEEKLTTGAYIDAEEAQKEKATALSNVLAIVCRPAGEDYDPYLNEDRAKMFAALPVSKIQGVLAFFLQYRIVLDQHTQAFRTLTEAVDLLPPNLLSSLRRGGGIKLSRIWQIIKYGILIKLLRVRLRKYLHSYNISATKT